MKNLFTFIVALFMATSVYAQTETVLIQKDVTYTGGQVLKSANTQLIMASSEETFSASKDGTLASTDPYVACVQGKKNPVDELNSAYEPSRKNLPVTGCYYVFTASKAGTLSLGIQLGPTKSFYVVDAKTGENSVEKTLKDRDGNTQELNEKQQLTEKMYGYVIFEVEANKSYYIFCTGSKLMIYGYQFTVATASSSENVTIGEAGFATHASKFAVDYSNRTDGLEAYSVSYSSSSKELTYTKIDGVVEAGKAVILKGKGDYVLEASSETATVTETGLKTSDGKKIGAENIYCLANKKNGVGFYQVANTVTIPANKAYLEIGTPATTPAKYYSIGIGGNTTGIQAIQQNGVKADGIMYSLSGQRVGENYKGIVICNGKKMIKK